MPQFHKVYRELRPEHWDGFHELATARRTTTDDAHDWLGRHGYRFNRSAVGSYMRHVRTSAMPLTREAVGDDLTLRRKLARWAGRIRGDDLRTLALFAAFLAGKDLDARRLGRRAAAQADAAARGELADATDQPTTGDEGDGSIAG